MMKNNPWEEKVKGKSEEFKVESFELKDRRGTPWRAPTFF